MLNGADCSHQFRVVWEEPNFLLYEAGFQEPAKGSRNLLRDSACLNVTY